MMFIDQTIVAIAIPKIQNGTWPSPRRGRSGSSTATCSRSPRCSRSAASSPTCSVTAAWSSSASSASPARLRAVRRGADRQPRRVVADRLPRRPGRVRRAAVPGRARDRRRRVRAARARQGARHLLRRHRRRSPRSVRSPAATSCQWTWRAIFWINIPIAIIALISDLRAKPAEERRPTSRSTARGAVLVSAGMGLVVLGLQQAGRVGLDARSPPGAASSSASCCSPPSCSSSCGSRTR